MPDSNSIVWVIPSSRATLRTPPEPSAFINVAASSIATLRTFLSAGFVNVVPSSQTILQTTSVLGKELVLKPSVAQASTTSPYVIIGDDTGIYDGTTNTWGYSPEPTGTIQRPARSELDLYVGYYWYQVGIDPAWTFADPQAPTTDPFTLSVYDVPTGVIQFCLIGVPTGTVLTSFQKENLYWLAQARADWFTGQIGYVYDNELYVDMWELRRCFTDARMCGNCKGTNLKIAEALEEGMIGALSVADYDSALIIYNKLKEFLGQIKCDCGC